MRVGLARPFRGLASDEDGAVLAMVGVSLIVLLGMLVLTFDLGRSVAIKRQMVNGTDAAALAAAQECARGGSVDASSAAASALLDENKGAAEVTSFSAPECGSLGTSGSKAVTVGSSVGVDYFFAPIFGVDSGTVTASATAVWGPVKTARPIPVTVNHDQLVGCSIPEDPPPPGETTHCELSYPKDTLGEPRWGVLDLTRWNEADAAPCHIDAETLRGQIEEGGWPVELPINDPPPGQPIGFTPDCVDNGLSFSVWDSLVGKTLTFPVIDVATSVGEGCTGADVGCQIDTANVIAFITLHVISAENDGSTVRLQVEWAPTLRSSGPVGGGPSYGDNTIRLVR